MSIFIYIFLVAICAYAQVSATQYTPTKGEVWPRPAKQIKYQTVYSFDLGHFDYELAGLASCQLLHQAIQRMNESITSIAIIAKNLKSESQNNSKDRPAMTELLIDLKSGCEEYPHANMDERYSLNISSSSTLQSNSIWGIIRGLETFTHLFYLSDDYKEVLINRTEIVDYPQYPYRGLLLDTGRHFLSLDIILRTLDAMAMNKMNVFHWHIVDDESFPYQSEKFPELSAKGAFHPLLVYSQANMSYVVQYARKRGIRVIPEIDAPGHVLSWGKSHPEILTNCSYQKRPLNPIKKDTYNLLRGLYKEVQELFPDTYLHLGGDEVNTDCWTDNKEINDYMSKHNLDENDLQTMFLNRTLPMFRKGTTSVVWEEVFLRAMNSLPSDIVVQVWGWLWHIKMYMVLKTQHKLIFSSSWYLGYKPSSYPFEKYYAGDPRAMMADWVSNSSLLDNILGGEACMWGELADDNNVMARVWPRASAIAEVLWSVTGGKVPADAHQRLEEHTCRMNRRGVGAEPPNGPGFCLTVTNTLPNLGKREKKQAQRSNSTK